MKNLLYQALGISLLLLIACQTQEQKMPSKDNKVLAFIGTYTQKEGHVDGKGLGVSIYECGPKATDWKLLNSFSDIINPSYLCLSPKHDIIYAVSEQGPDVPEPKSIVKVIQYSPKDFEMKAIQEISAEGHAPCYVSTDQDGHFLYIANYVSGNIVSYRIKEDGTLESGISHDHKGAALDSIPQKPHAHFIQQHPMTNDVYAVDLGINQIIRYEATDQGLLPNDKIQIEKGSGPRHLVWHSEGQLFFVLNELTGTIESWLWNEESKERKQIIDLKPKDQQGFAGAGDIHISKDGLFLYASLRGDFNEIIALSINPNSYKLDIVQRISAGGAVPRNFAISPSEDYLAVALQNSGLIQLFKRDAQTGKLSTDSEAVEVKTPVCVVFR